MVDGFRDDHRPVQNPLQSTSQSLFALPSTTLLVKLLVLPVAAFVWHSPLVTCSIVHGKRDLLQVPWFRILKKPANTSLAPTPSSVATPPPP